MTYGQNRAATRPTRTAFGFEVLGGYWLSDADQAYARWQWLYPGRKASAGTLLNGRTPSTRLNMLTVGWNHHMGGNVKLSVDWSWNFSDPATTTLAQRAAALMATTGWWGGGSSH